MRRKNFNFERISISSKAGNNADVGRKNVGGVHHYPSNSTITLRASDLNWKSARLIKAADLQPICAANNIAQVLMEYQKIEPTRGKFFCVDNNSVNRWRNTRGSASKFAADKWDRKAIFAPFATMSPVNRRKLKLSGLLFARKSRHAQRLFRTIYLYTTIFDVIGLREYPRNQFTGSSMTYINLIFVWSLACYIGRVLAIQKPIQIIQGNKHKLTFLALVSFSFDH